MQCRDLNIATPSSRFQLGLPQKTGVTNDRVFVFYRGSVCDTRAAGLTHDDYYIDP